MVVLQDLKQQKFTIEAEPTETVRSKSARSCPPPLMCAGDQIAQVKEKVAAEKGWDAAQQKLIYSGLWTFVDMTESFSMAG